MTVLEAERLVRRIRAILAGDADHVLGAKVAEDYAEVSRAVQFRLQQCETIIRAGNPRQAIQLAEASPNLLDLANRITFLEDGDWQALCTDQGWPVPEQYAERERITKQLQALYAEGITSGDALYRDYRRAMLKRNEEAALAVLKSIGRFNPDDKDTQAELARLDAKVLKLRLGALEKSLAEHDEPAVVQQAVEIEECGFQKRPTGSVWETAQLVRCKELLARLERLRATNRWQDGLDYLEQVQSLIAMHKLKPSPEMAKRLQAAELWISTEQRNAENDAELRSLAAKLRQMLRESAERDLDGPKGTPVEWEAEFQELNRLWHGIEAHGKSVPEELADACRQRCASLKRAMVGRKRSRFRRVAVAVVIGAAIVIGSTWLWFGNSRSREYSAQISSLQKQRQVRAVATLLERIRSEEGKMMVSPALRAAMAQADHFVSQEQTALKSFEQVLAGLPAQFAGLSNATLIAQSATTIAQATNLFSALAPDLQAEQAAGFQSYAQRWATFLNQRAVALNTQFEAALVEAERINAQLNSSQDLVVARAELKRLTGLLATFGDLADVSSAGLVVRNELRTRLERCKSSADAWSTAFGKHDSLVAELPKVQTKAAYDLAMQELSKSPLTNSPYVLSARNLARFKITDDFILQSLLFPSNSVAFQFLKQNPSPRFIARQVVPAERRQIETLATAPSVQPELRRYRFTQVPKGGSFSWITLGAVSAAAGRSTIPAFCPEEQSESFALVPRDFDSYGGHLRVAIGALKIPTSGLQTLTSGTTSGSALVAIEDAGPCSETSALTQKLRTSLLNPQIDQHSICLLQALDELRDSRAGSPIFRAFLFIQLAHLAESQPEEWGAAFVPAVGRHRAELEKLAIKWGDWFIATKEGTLGKSALESLDTLPKHSYRQQAQSIAAIGSEVLNAGLTYVGFLGLDGKPVLLRESSNTELLGLALDSGRAMVVAGQKTAGQQRLQPLCPLFELGTKRASILDKVKATQGIQFPPLFDGMAR